MSEQHEHRIEIKKGNGEILPPLDEEPMAGRVFYSSGHGTVKIVKLGPFGAIMLMLAIGLILAFGFLFLGGVLMLLIPLLLVGGAAAYLAGRLGAFNRLLR